MGSRFTAKILFPPTRDIVESTTSKKWPQIKPGAGSRLVKLLALGAGLNRTISVDRDKVNLWLEAAWKDLIWPAFLSHPERAMHLARKYPDLRFAEGLGLPTDTAPVRHYVPWLDPVFTDQTHDARLPLHAGKATCVVQVAYGWQRYA